MSQIILQLPDEVVNRLESEAKRRQISVDDLVREAVESYLDDDEPTEEEILEDIRQGMLDALAGRTFPADEVIEELRRKYSIDADNY